MSGCTNTIETNRTTNITDSNKDTKKTDEEEGVGVGFTIPKGSTKDSNGNIVTPDGNTFNKKGEWVVPEGGHVDLQGRIVKKNGNLLAEAQRLDLLVDLYAGFILVTKNMFKMLYCTPEGDSAIL